jgi:hypothetical protein
MVQPLMISRTAQIEQNLFANILLTSNLKTTQQNILDYNNK